MEPIVVVGGGLAAARATQTLRDQGYDGDLVVLTAEAFPPYERPPLSKDYLRGEAGTDALFPHDADWYADRGVDLRTSTTAVGLDVAGSAIETAPGGSLRYSRLLLATGSQVRRLDVPGNDLDGVHHLRTIDDADRLRTALGDDGPLVVVGDGWIGMEVAASARQLGRDVTVVGRSPHPLHGLGARVSEIFTNLHEENGVRLLRATAVTALTGTGSVSGVELDDGTTLEASTVVVGVGVTPRCDLAAEAGIELRSAADGDGVAVDGTLRTSAPGVWAAGDIASVPSVRYGRALRVEHWAFADETGKHAARAMLGSAEPYDVLPYFFTDQFDLGMEVKGVTSGEVVISGSAADRECVAFWVDGDRVQAGMGINVWDRMDDVEDLIRAEGPVDRAALDAFV
ncbi:FAD-dependent oxidoreductase [Isoptericola halotolerans]|uniref:NADPH-dependent 2,4-dienoyl-CoA reductase/sulfur reductase-like enzyme n=1 Tax=Isoptericola halotolerans TaxID=300560 RepID=A0ABX2A5T7_9MICO|nr:FAD-dependent oxidoreductase [Isoptericola halotolerans]NOV97157.1 NADPH-dependent 2,4-dienoyl-CoA reductase/sulfur reductase-like enzyme [Isoptericola halotolerans]